MLCDWLLQIALNDFSFLQAASPRLGGRGRWDTTDSSQPASTAWMVHPKEFRCSPIYPHPYIHYTTVDYRLIAAIQITHAPPWYRARRGFLWHGLLYSPPTFARTMGVVRSCLCPCSLWRSHPGPHAPWPDEGNRTYLVPGWGGGRRGTGGLLVQLEDGRAVSSRFAHQHTEEITGRVAAHAHLSSHWEAALSSAAGRGRRGSLLREFWLAQRKS